MSHDSASDNSEMSYGSATLYINDQLVSEHPVSINTMGTELAIHGTNLRAAGIQALGLPVSFLDPGFGSVASCESAITYIKGDGEKGLLFYRGFPIEDLALSCDFIEVAYLLIHGNLPNQKELDEFNTSVKSQLILDEQVTLFFNGYRRDAHPMSMLLGVISALSSLYEDVDIHNPEMRLSSAVHLVAKTATIAAMIYKYNLGQPFVPPRNDLSYSENILNMMFSSSVDDSEINPVYVKALDKILLLHADHEQNASTSTVRVVGSTLANPFAAIASGIAALWGPAHGGANEACLNMLEEIGHVDNIDAYIARAKDPEDSFRLMGFGHRVYKNYDPRAKIMRSICHDVLAQSEESDPLFDLAMRLEDIALNDPYFVSRKLYPNVDFYSGIILRAMGIPTNFFTVIFALGRMPGWLAHWHEMYSQEGLRISRPRQLYTGSKQRNIHL